MSRDTSKDAEDQVERAILAALRQRADEPVFSEEEDEALISAAVTAHLEVAQQGQTRKSAAPWIAAAGLLAAAAAVALWLLPADQGPAESSGQAVAQADTSAPTQAMWSLEGQASTDRETCGKRDGTRACLTPGSRGVFEPDGNLELQAGAVRVETQEPIVLSLADVNVHVTTQAAYFSATLKAQAWTVSVESGAVTITDADGASQVLEAGESAGNESPTAKIPADAADAPDAPEPAEKAGPRESKKPTPSADELLKLARSQRAAKDFAAAARTYEQLVRVHPNSTKVRAALVSLAQLYQGPLDDQAKALRHFDRYLERGGPLAEEAHYGKIRALRSLGRSALASKEVDAFLGRYPDSAYADALRGN